MSTVIFEEIAVQIPVWVTDWESFRRWARSEDSPEEGRIGYWGEVWVDMSKEQIFSHNQVKSEYAFALMGLAKTERPGRYFTDGVLLSNEEADLSCQPDGLYVSTEGFQSGRVRLVEGARQGYVELEGSPEMVLEVVSDSSVDKDTEILLNRYWRASVVEYWLVDARDEELDFRIYRHTTQGYEAVYNPEGWPKSEVFGRSFRLSQTIDALGHPQYLLESKVT